VNVGMYSLSHRLLRHFGRAAAAGFDLPGLPGGLRPSIDFTSGTLMTRFESTVEQSGLRDTLAELGHPEAVVQRSGEGDFIIRTAPLAQPRTDSSAGVETISGRQHIETALSERHGPLEVLNLDQVSPLIAAEIVQYSVIATAAASGFILLYVWWAFRGVTHPWRFGVTAVVALLHDALVVLGLFSLLGRLLPIEIEATFIVAVLTVIGFSVHDTIVTFDRVRENTARHVGDPFEDIVNHSIAQTIVRSLITSLTVLLTLVVLLLFGGSTIQAFVLALLIGMAVGTYSSIFVASMLLVSWHLGELHWLGLRAAVSPSVGPQPEVSG
jgi:preprotein translocase subunit SecF